MTKPRAKQINPGGSTGDVLTVQSDGSVAPAAPVTAVAPVGSILQYAGSSAPSGWLLCDGSDISQSTYSALYAIIGTDYGDPGGGDFTLPDARARIPMGVNNSGLPNGANGSFTTRDVADAGGAETDGTTSDGWHSHDLQNHTHSMNSHTHSVTGQALTHSVSAGSQIFAGGGAVWKIDNHASHNHGGATGGPSTASTNTPSTNSTNGTGSHGHTADIVQPFVTFNFIIKY